jgi:hypothetical protein
VWVNGTRLGIMLEPMDEIQEKTYILSQLTTLTEVYGHFQVVEAAN